MIKHVARGLILGDFTLFWWNPASNKHLSTMYGTIERYFDESAVEVTDLNFYHLQ